MLGLRLLGDLLRFRAPDRPGPEAERHASWLELFFDLVFVLALSGITERLDEHGRPTGGELGIAVGIYILVQWSWAGQAFFDARFDLDDVPHRLLVLLATAGAGAEALGTRESSASLLLPIGYLIVRGALILSYVRVYLSDQPAGEVVHVYLFGFSIGWLLWASSLALAPNLRPVLWLTGLVVEQLTPWIGNGTLRRFKVNATHLPERIGQFTIILLGSTLTDLSSAVPTFQAPVRVVLAAAVAFVLPACIWWVYTTFLTSRLAIPRLATGRAYSTIHVPAGAAILFLGWALGRIIDEIHAESSHTPWMLRAVFGGSIVAWMVSGLLLQWFALGSISRRRVKIAVGGILPIVAVATLVEDPALLLILTALVMIGYAVANSRQIATRAADTGPTGPPGSGPGLGPLEVETD